MKYILLSALMLISSSAYATVWQVGPTRTYKSPSKVMGLVADGDTVAIDSGLYSGDVGEWTKNDLVIYCPIGRAHLNANGQISEKKGIWVVSGNNTSIDGIEFYGAAISVSDGNNGAGIRMQGSSLTLRNCYFHDNQDGILTGAGVTSDIDIEACEFARNGAGDGFSHNMYIGNVRSFTLKYCYVHEASVGHEVKSRANSNFILYNLIVDQDSSSSYDIDLPNGGFSIVEGNSIMKGPNAQNTVLVNYGEEGLKNLNSEIYVINNTFLSTRGTSTKFIQVAAGTTIAEARNNIFAGAGTFTSGTVDLAMSAASNDTSTFHFMDVTHDDYRLTTTYTGMHVGVDPGIVKGFALLPTMEYVNPLDSAMRFDNPPAIGAFPAVQTQSQTFSVSNVDFGTIEVNSIDTSIAMITDVAAGRIDTILSITVDDPQVSFLDVPPIFVGGSGEELKVRIAPTVVDPNFITFGHFFLRGGATWTDTIRANIVAKSSVSMLSPSQQLLSNSPNPFWNSTEISLPLSFDGERVQVAIYNSIGTLAASSVVSVKNSKATIDRGDLHAGVYFYKISNPNQQEMLGGKLVIVP